VRRASLMRTQDFVMVTKDIMESRGGQVKRAVMLQSKNKNFSVARARSSKALIKKASTDMMRKRSSCELALFLIFHPTSRTCSAVSSAYLTVKS